MRCWRSAAPTCCPVATVRPSCRWATCGCAGWRLRRRWWPWWGCRAPRLRGWPAADGAAWSASRAGPWTRCRPTPAPAKGTRYFQAHAGEGSTAIEGGDAGSAKTFRDNTSPEYASGRKCETELLRRTIAQWPGCKPQLKNSWHETTNCTTYNHICYQRSKLFPFMPTKNEPFLIPEVISNFTRQN